MARELILLALRAISGHRLRSVLSMLGIGIGITSVILLTSIGEGTKRYIMGQFTQFGTNILAVNPGKAETTGLPGALGGSTRHLTIADAQALERISGVEAVMPMAFGMAKVEARDRGRSVYVYGVTPQAPLIWQWDVRIGSFSDATPASVWISLTAPDQSIPNESVPLLERTQRGLPVEWSIRKMISSNDREAGDH